MSGLFVVHCPRCEERLQIESTGDARCPRCFTRVLVSGGYLLLPPGVPAVVPVVTSDSD